MFYKVYNLMSMLLTSKCPATLPFTTFFVYFSVVFVCYLFFFPDTGSFIYFVKYFGTISNLKSVCKKLINSLSNKSVFAFVCEC